MLFSCKDICSGYLELPGTPPSPLVQIGIMGVDRLYYDAYAAIGILIVLRGRLEVYAEGQSFCLCPDDLIVINSHMFHAFLPQEENTLVMNLRISPEIFFECTHQSGRMYFRCCSCADDRNSFAVALVRKYAAMLYSELSHPSQEGMMLAKSVLWGLCSILLRYYPPAFREETLVTPEAVNTLQRALRFIKKNSRNNLTLEQVANHVHLSRTYFCTFFRKCIGITFYEYLNWLRIAHACELLIAKDFPLLQVAVEAGFPNDRAMNRFFKQYFHMTPGQFRNSSGSGIHAGTAKKRHIYSIKDAFVTDILRRYSGPISYSSPSVK